jgi:hypothetical protein
VKYEYVVVTMFTPLNLDGCNHAAAAQHDAECVGARIRRAAEVPILSKKAL